MTSRQKQEAMRSFAEREADVLVATSVIEVGIDVPNATVMIIEAAERYGISQLHQLRGRIGRGSHASVCILFGEPGLPRLQAPLPTSATASGWPRSTSSCAAPATCSARASTACRSSAWRSIPDDLPLLERARAPRRGAARRATPRSTRRSTRCCATPPPRCSGPSSSRSRRERAAAPRPSQVVALRIVAGALGGRRIEAPAGRCTRPTADRVREALFSILGDVEGCACSTSSPARARSGIEALSRGAAAAVFVDSDPRAVAAIRRNVDALGTRRRAFTGRDAFAWLGKAARGLRPSVRSTPHIVPLPGLAARLSELLPAVLRESSLTVTESDKRTPLELTLPLVDERIYGDTRIAIHRGR